MHFPPTVAIIAGQVLTLMQKLTSLSFESMNFCSKGDIIEAILGSLRGWNKQDILGLQLGARDTHEAADLMEYLLVPIAVSGMNDNTYAETRTLLLKGIETKLSETICLSRQ